MHSPYVKWPQTCTVHWTACPRLSWSAVAMHALTWVVFTLKCWRCIPAIVLLTDSRLGMRTFQCLHELFKCAQLKFTVYGQKQTYTNVLNGVSIMQACPNHYIVLISLFELWVHKGCNILNSGLCKQWYGTRPWYWGDPPWVKLLLVQCVCVCVCVC